MISVLMKHRPRILAVWFPYLAAERVLRQRLGRSWRSIRPPDWPPLVLSQRDRNAQRIAALDEQAEALMLKRGMGVADARARFPAIDVVEAEPEADQRLLEGLADWCDRYTPLVAIEGTDGLFLDISGCAHLFGGEEAMMMDLLSRLYGQGFDARAGLGSTPGAAWAAARFNLHIVAAGEEKKALAPLPLAALRLDAATRGGLESVGLRTAGAIMQAPRAPLVRRFGKTPVLRLDQALGDVEEPISPRLPIAVLSVERHLAEPISQMEDIERLIGLLATSLKSDLERRDEGARKLEFTLFRVDGAVRRLTVGASRPQRDPLLIEKLFHEKLAALEGGVEADCGFELVRLSVLAASQFPVRQADLAEEASDEDDDIALFADRVRARLGDHAVLQAALVESHLPERAVGLAPFVAAGEGKREAQETSSAGKAERPIRLFSHAESVDVLAEVPDGPPLHFRWRRALYRVARSEGPERIAPEWWRASGDEATRDYFRVEDEAGRRFWLYRQGLYGVSDVAPRWFLQGVFA